MNRVFYGDCRDSMRTLHADGVRVQCCVTSPPYFGLRDYGVQATHWPAISYATLGGVVDVPAMDCCLGLEATPDAFVGHLVDVFRGVRDLLADDGVCWLNLGDSYAGSNAGAGDTSSRNKSQEASRGLRSRASLKVAAKNLLGIPWQVAFALQAGGWYLRQDIIWSKPNPMPESVTDRCTKSHEYLFLLSKSERYYFDADAIKEAAVGGLAGNTQPTKAARAYTEGASEQRTAVGLHDYADRQRSKRDSFKRDDSKRAQVIPGQSVGTHLSDRDESEWDVERRNKRSVWEVATQPYSGAHFATFPPKLIEPCIMAGSRAGDVVLDPFFGSGTTGQVSERLGRRWIGCELQEKYAPLHAERTGQSSLMLLSPVAEAAE